MATALFPVAAPDVVYLIDLSSYVLRAYHAIAPLSSPSGEPTHAVHGTVTLLERLVRELGEFYAEAQRAERDRNLERGRTRSAGAREQATTYAQAMRLLRGETR